MVYSTKDVVDLVAVAMLPIGFIGLMTQRLVTKKAIGAKAIQFIAVVFLLPVILILALEKVLDGTTIGTLLGAVTGYLLSGIANDDRQSGSDSEPR